MLLFVIVNRAEDINIECYLNGGKRQALFSNRRVKIILSCKLIVSRYWPVCVRVCLLRSKVSLKPFPQKVQRYLLMSEWHFMCRLSRRCKAKVLLHIRQQKCEEPSSAVIAVTLVLVSSLRLPGRPPTTGSWLASGFLIPWPPFTNSSCTSAGSPNCETEIDHSFGLIETARRIGSITFSHRHNVNVK